MALLSFFQKRSFEVKTYSITSDKISSPLRLLFLSDFHEEHHGAANSELLYEARRRNPDLILCGGDMIVGRGTSHASVGPLMASLCAIAPVYFTNGNHETQLAKYKPSAWKVLYNDLRRSGVRMLNNQSADLDLKGSRLRLTGLETDLEKYRKFTHPHLSDDELQSSIGPAPDGPEFRILLAHNPYFGDAYFNWGADLILCGHNHGGVMRLGGNRILLSPYGWPLPEYGYGLYNRGGQNLIITSGLGEHTIPFRIHNPMEMVLIRLFPENTEEDAGAQTASEGVEGNANAQTASEGVEGNAVPEIGFGGAEGEVNET